jgi:hypothetical protein
MRLWAALGGAVLALLAITGGASAEPRVLSHYSDVTPRLAGETVVWSERHNFGMGGFANKPDLVFAAGPGEQPRRIFELPARSQLVELSATDGRAALLSWGQGEPDGLWTSDLRGFRRIDSDDESGCSELSADLDGSRLANAAANCEHQGITVRDLTGSAPPVRVPANPVPFGSDDGRTKVRLAGRYVAWSEYAPEQPGRPNWLILYDWVQQREVTRLDMSTLVGGDRQYSPASFFDFDLGPDGTVVFAAGNTNGGKASNFDWLSPADPRPHPIPVSVWAGRPELAGNLVAVHRRRPDDLAVVGLDGRVVDVFERERIVLPKIAFNGRRLAWSGTEFFGQPSEARLGLSSLVTEEFPRPPGPPDVIERLAVTPKRFVAGRRPRSSRRPRVARVRYSVTRPARSRVRIERAIPGRRTRRGCRKARRRVPRRRRCTAWARVTTTAAAETLGTVARGLSGRVGGRVLRPGRYRLTVLATLSKGTAARPERTGFRVLRR